MRKINYPADIRSFKSDFIKSVPDLKDKAKRWRDLWNTVPQLQPLFPKRIHKIILAEYKKLIIIYVHYTRHVKTALSDAEFKNLNDKLIDIFDYKNAQPTLAEFFMRHAGELDLSVCHYCESAYINAYSTSDSQILNRINNANKNKLKQYLKVSDKNADKVCLNRPFSSPVSFNQFWVNHIRKTTTDKFSMLRFEGNHFDLDHVLDKGNCPILALSLMNFVPSCQVCNEKLKRSSVLGGNIKSLPIEKLSPTSPLFAFDSMVQIELKTKNSIILNPAYALSNRDFYDLEFNCIDPDYSNYIDLFKLEERYQFHKAEGLYWLQTKWKYTNTAISMISNSLNSGMYSFSRLKEDIFRLEYDRIRKPCFDKMKRDILK